jgi:hypothetical protein
VSITGISKRVSIYFDNATCSCMNIHQHTFRTRFSSCASGILFSIHSKCSMNISSDRGSHWIIRMMYEMHSVAWPCAQVM